MKSILVAFEIGEKVERHGRLYFNVNPRMISDTINIRVEILRLILQLLYIIVAYCIKNVLDKMRKILFSQNLLHISTG